MKLNLIRHILALLLIILLHLALLQVASNLQVTQLRAQELIVPVTLYEPPKPPEPPAFPKATASPTDKPATSKKTAPEPAPVETVPESPIPNSALSIALSSTVAANTRTIEQQPFTESATGSTIEDANTSAQLSTRLPGSADYLLEVVRTEPKLNNAYHGSSEIRWKHDNRNYSLYIDIGVDILFATVRLYSLQSHGNIEHGAIRPQSIAVNRRNKSTDTIDFNYDAHTIHFSSNNTNTPLLENAQDQATVLIQLAGIANADPNQLQPGKTITIQVAEGTGAVLHRFVVLDYEDIDTKLGRLNTLHIIRPPDPGNYSSRIDIWLAAKLNWLPVQLRNTEANGAITTQTIRKIISGINDDQHQ